MPHFSDPLISWCDIWCHIASLILTDPRGQESVRVPIIIYILIAKTPVLALGLVDSSQYNGTGPAIAPTFFCPEMAVPLLLHTQGPIRRVMLTHRNHRVYLLRPDLNSTLVKREG